MSEYNKEIIEKVEQDNIATLKELQEFIRKQYDIEIEQSWLSRYCKKNSIFLTKKQG